MRHIIPERSWRAVPRWHLGLLGVALSAQLLWHSHFPPPTAPTPWRPPAPSAPLLRALSLGDPIGSAKLLSLWLQGFDWYAGNFQRLSAQDYPRLIAWMSAVLALDPHSQYVLLLASRVYAHSPHPAQQRQILAFVHQAFFIDPARRWQWLLDALMLARHRLKDPDLALTYAQALAAQVPAVPLSAASLYLFLLDERGQFAAVRAQLAAWQAAGYVDAPTHALLHRRLQALRDATAALPTQ